MIAHIMFRFAPRYGRSKAVVFNSRTVAKRVDPAFLDLEVQIANAARALGTSSSLFYTPRVLSADRSSAVIEFERLRGLVTISQFLEKDPLDTGILRRIGSALACVHRSLSIPEGARLTRPSAWPISDAVVVPLHGDFNTINICYHVESDRVIFLDWASAPRLGFRFTVGPRYVDLAHFVFSLTIHQANFPQSIRRLRLRTRSFLAGYHANSDTPVNLAILGSFLLWTSRALFPQRTRYNNVLKWLYHAGIAAIARATFSSMSKAWVTARSARQAHRTGSGPP